MCARTQGNTKESTLRSKRKIAEDRKGKARGSYGARASSERDGKIVSSVSGEVLWRGDRYFRTTNGLLLPVKWRDVYDCVVGRITPATWRERMARAAPEGMSELDKERERFSMR